MRSSLYIDPVAYKFPVSDWHLQTVNSTSPTLMSPLCPLSLYSVKYAQYYSKQATFSLIIRQEYLASRAKLIDPSKTNPQVVHVSIIVIYFGKYSYILTILGQPGEIIGYCLLLRYDDFDGEPIKF